MVILLYDRFLTVPSNVTQHKNTRTTILSANNNNNNDNNNKSLFSAGYGNRTRTSGVLTTTPRTPLVLRFASWVRCHCSTCSLRYACKSFEHPAQVPRKFGLAASQAHCKCYKSVMSSNNRPQDVSRWMSVRRDLNWDK